MPRTTSPPAPPFAPLASFKPIVHVHACGSGGTSFCRLALRQPLRGRKTGGGYNCQLPCKDPGGFLRYSLLPEKLQSEPEVCQLSGQRSTCAGFERVMRSRGYYVMAAIETLLDEHNSSAYADAVREAPARLLHELCPGVRRGTGPGLQRGCCGCNAPSLFEPEKFQMLSIPRGAPSPFARVWPAEGLPFVGSDSLCANLRYTFLMHDPLRRIATLLLERCPLARSRSALNASCVAWAAGALGDLYERSMVLEYSTALFIGTPSASNHYLRTLLGPRAYFLGLDGVRRRHVQSATEMLSRFTFVAPVHALSASGPLIERRLGWPVSHIPPGGAFVTGAMAHVHRMLAPLRPQLLEAADEMLRRHNRWDLELYAWVESKFRDDLREAQSG